MSLFCISADFDRCYAAGSKRAAPSPKAGSAAGLQKYLDAVQSKIRYNWYPAKSKADDGYVTLRFRLHKNGQISWVELTDASAVEAVNQAAEDAISRAQPFAPLPAGAGDAIDLSVDFFSTFSPVNRVAYARPIGQVQAQKLFVQARASQSNKDFDKALRMYESAHESNPFDKNITDALVDCKLVYSKNTTPEAAVSMMHECLLLASDRQDVRERLNSLLKAAGVNPADAQARIDLARVCASKGAFDDAIAEYGESWLLKKDPQTFAEINTCLLRRKNYAAVKKWTAAAKVSDTIDNHLALAQAFESCDLKSSAIDEYRIVHQKSADNKVARAALKRLAPGEKLDPDEEEEEEPPKKTEEDEDESADKEKTKTLSLEATPPVAADPTQLSDDFPYLALPSCKLKVTALSNRQPIVDYLKEACGKNLIRWASNRIPLTVYVESGAGVPGYRPQFRQHLIDAFAAWQAGSDGRIRYKIVGGPTGANIICHWTADPKDKRMTGREQGITYFKFLVNNPNTGMVQSAEITILIKDRYRFQVLSDDAMKSVCLHELGHSLGIAGHSPARTDIMFPSMTINGWFPKELSERDKATMRRLYQAYSHPHF